MALAAPPAGWLIARLPAERVAGLGVLVVGTGLFLVGSWPEGASPAVIALTLAIQGFGTGLFQVAYMDIVMRSSPIADRGVAGSLAILTRTIGTVTGAALLTLIFHALQTGDDAAGFLDAFHGVFHIAGAAVAVSSLAIPWWRSRHG